MIKLSILKAVAYVASFIAVADVSAYSLVLFYQPEIPAQLKK